MRHSIVACGVAALLVSGTALAEPVVIRQHEALALAPRGDRIVDVEALDPGDLAECPAPQSVEYWRALKTLGTPTQLMIYAGEGHHFRDPKHLEDLRARIVGWFERYLR
jgi:hypothetical protein